MPRYTHAFSHIGSEKYPNISRTEKTVDKLLLKPLRHAASAGRWKKDAKVDPHQFKCAPKTMQRNFIFLFPFA